jgi:hypothetical protein
MNLIMSEVEETIMLVDAESVTNGQGVVNVCYPFRYYLRDSDLYTLITQRRSLNGKWRCCL